VCVCVCVCVRVRVCLQCMACLCAARMLWPPAGAGQGELVIVGGRWGSSLPEVPVAQDGPALSNARQCTGGPSPARGERFSRLLRTLGSCALTKPRQAVGAAAGRPNPRLRYAAGQIPRCKEPRPSLSWRGQKQRCPTWHRASSKGAVNSPKR